MYNLQYCYNYNIQFWCMCMSAILPESSILQRQTSLGSQWTIEPSQHNRPWLLQWWRIQMWYFSGCLSAFLNSALNDFSQRVLKIWTWWRSLLSIQEGFWLQLLIYLSNPEVQGKLARPRWLLPTYLPRFPNPLYEVTWRIWLLPYYPTRCHPTISYSMNFPPHAHSNYVHTTS